ncbi:MAG: DUF6476 family protein [Pseudomonadota bacterium]
MTSDAPSTSPGGTATPGSTASAAEAQRADAQKRARQLFWLKALVIGLGVAIVLMMIAIIVRMVMIVAGTDSATVPADTEIELAVPDGEISGIGLSSGRIALQFEGSDGKRIVVYDIATGAAVRRFRMTRGLASEPPQPQREGRSTAEPND